MGLTNRLDLKQVITAYLFANTPMYLYRHLRYIDSVEELGKRTTLKALVKEYDKRTSKEQRSTKDIAVAYALLVAITFWEYRRALAAFDDFELSRLNWGNDIKDIFISTSPITDILNISAKLTYPSTKQTASDSSTGTLVLDLTDK